MNLKKNLGTTQGNDVPDVQGIKCMAASDEIEKFAEDRIVVDPAVCSGKPTIRGTRIMVRNILGMIAGGYTTERIMKAYPELSENDISAALDKIRVRKSH